MFNPRITLTTLPAIALLSLSSMAQAGPGGFGSITFAPSSVGSTAVPLLSNALLVVLGLLLAVIAVRTLKANRGLHKYLSVAVLAGGLAVGGIGVERTYAIVYSNEIVASTDLSCDAASSTSYNAITGGIFLNDCGTSGTVVNEATQCSCGVNEGTCDGASIPAQGDCQLEMCALCLDN